MAKITPVLRTSKADRNGHVPIWLRIADTYKSVYVSLGVSLHPRHWNPKKQSVRQTHPNAELLNVELTRFGGELNACRC